MVALEITRAEVESGSLSPERLATAVKAVREDGFVVLNNVVDVAHLAVLQERMLADVAAIIARPDAPYNFNANNVQQDPPPFPPYLFRDVLLNDMVIAVTKGVLGSGVKNDFYSGNTALPGGTRQPVHADTGQLWPNLEVATPAFGLVVNIPVVDVTPENGSTEIWPGTHLDTTVDIQMDIKVPEAALERRRAQSKPFQPSVRCGGALIRDIRLWHCGMPNHTDQPRPMIAMIHWIHWMGHGKIRFSKSAEAFLKHPDLTTEAEFIDDSVDYLHHNHAYDYEPAGKEG